MEKLIGKKIESVTIFGDYHNYILFKTDLGDVKYFADGDCCSSSFFSEIFNADNIIGQVIKEVKDIPLEDGEAPNRGATEDDNEKVYGIHITSDKGTCTIIFRNHSNGYYGGSIEETEEKLSNNKSWFVEKDWSAPSL